MQYDNSASDFFRELFWVLTRTIDGLCALAWCLYLIGRDVFLVVSGGALGDVRGILLVPVILLFVARARLGNKSLIINFESLISVNFICIYSIYKGVL